MSTLPPTAPVIGTFQHRPEIDGLRSIAVISVVLFHAGLGVPGGFVGVDVFFVISGFLITSLILRDLELGRFTLALFWERRARRIIPASVVMVLATLAAGWFVLLPTDFSKLGESALWQSVFAANIHFWKHTNYFAGIAEEQPLLHTWSLAVEEQFYLFMPLILLWVFRHARLRGRAGLLILFSAAFVFSLVLSVVALPRAPSATFYLLPTRAWELLAGSIAAVLPAPSCRRIWREAGGWLALALIVVPCFLYDRQTAFPGLAALPPCLGTAWFIHASRTTPDGQALITPARLLAGKAPVFIGLISYSLYLWHWPIFAFHTCWALEPFSLGHRLLMVALSFVLAILSWRFVEQPFRHRRLGTSRGTMFGHAATGLAAIIGLAAAISWMNGFPTRFTPLVFAFDAVRSESDPSNRLTSPLSLDDARAGRFPRVGAPAPAPVHLLVWGDSHARSILPALTGTAERHGAGIVNAWHSSTPPALDYLPYEGHEGFSMGSDCPAFNRAVLDQVRAQRIPHVLLAARWRDYFGPAIEPGPVLESEPFARQLLETVKAISAAGAVPWILAEMPAHPVQVPKALVSHELFGTDLTRFSCSIRSHSARSAAMAELMPTLVMHGARRIDTPDLLLDRSSGIYRMSLAGQALYYDDHHLTRFAAGLLAHSFDPLFANAGERAAFAPASKASPGF